MLFLNLKSIIIFSMMIENLSGFLPNSTISLSVSPKKFSRKRLNQIVLQRKDFQAKRDSIQSLIDISDLVHLNVRGQRISTRRRTLSKVANSTLAAYFNSSSNETLQPDYDGSYFLDYNPLLFSHLLDQLRDLRPNEPPAFRPPPPPASAKSFNEMLTALKLPVAQRQGSDLVVLNVGGEIITTFREIFLRQNLSLPARRDEYGRVFFDEDPEVFRSFLAELQQGKSIDELGGNEVYRQILKTFGVISRVTTITPSDNDWSSTGNSKLSTTEEKGANSTNSKKTTRTTFKTSVKSTPSSNAVTEQATTTTPRASQQPLKLYSQRKNAPNKNTTEKKMIKLTTKSNRLISSTLSNSTEGLTSSPFLRTNEPKTQNATHYDLTTHKDSVVYQNGDAKKDDQEILNIDSQATSVSDDMVSDENTTIANEEGMLVTAQQTKIYEDGGTSTVAHGTTTSIRQTTTILVDDDISSKTNRDQRTSATNKHMNTIFDADETNDLYDDTTDLSSTQMTIIEEESSVGETTSRLLDENSTNGSIEGGIKADSAEIKIPFSAANFDEEGGPNGNESLATAITATDTVINDDENLHGMISEVITSYNSISTIDEGKEPSTMNVPTNNIVHEDLEAATTIPEENAVINATASANESDQAPPSFTEVEEISTGSSGRSTPTDDHILIKEDPVANRSQERPVTIREVTTLYSLGDNVNEDVQDFSDAVEETTVINQDAASHEYPDNLTTEDTAAENGSEVFISTVENVSTTTIIPDVVTNMNEDATVSMNDADEGPGTTISSDGDEQMLKSGPDPIKVEQDDETSTVDWQTISATADGDQGTFGKNEEVNASDATDGYSEILETSSTETMMVEEESSVGETTTSRMFDENTTIESIESSSKADSSVNAGEEEKLDENEPITTASPATNTVTNDDEKLHVSEQNTSTSAIISADEKDEASSSVPEIEETSTVGIDRSTPIDDHTTSNEDPVVNSSQAIPSTILEVTTVSYLGVSMNESVQDFSEVTNQDATSDEYPKNTTAENGNEVFISTTEKEEATSTTTMNEDATVSMNDADKEPGTTISIDGDEQILNSGPDPFKVEQEDETSTVDWQTISTTADGDQGTFGKNEEVNTSDANDGYNEILETSSTPTTSRMFDENSTIGSIEETSEVDSAEIKIPLSTGDEIEPLVTTNPMTTTVIKNDEQTHEIGPEETVVFNSNSTLMEDDRDDTLDQTLNETIDDVNGTQENQETAATDLEPVTTTGEDSTNVTIYETSTIGQNYITTTDHGFITAEDQASTTIAIDEQGDTNDDQEITTTTQEIITLLSENRSVDEHVEVFSAVPENTTIVNEEPSVGGDDLESNSTLEGTTLMNGDIIVDEAEEGEKSMVDSTIVPTHNE